MDDLLEKYKAQEPEITFEWSDSETSAKGWVVINSLRGGAAGGGTRMRKGLNKSEVVSLAKVMEVKFSVCGPPIGGAKSGIDFDPSDPRREMVLKRWYRAIFPLLKNYYGTGGDLDVDIRDVIEITEDLGLWHPQEGIVSGHFRASKGQKVKILGFLRSGVSKRVEHPEYSPEPNSKYSIADMVTGYGVAESVKHFYDLYGKGPLKGKKVIIQGWGNVASSAGLFLSKAGAGIVGILDRSGGLIKPEGLDHEMVVDLFMHKKGNKLETPGMISFEEAQSKIWDLKADIFIPGAASRLITRDQVNRLLKNGLELISCGANVPFIDDDIFFGPTARYVDSKISLIPDFIANCGMARVFAYLMQSGSEVSDETIFLDVSNTIRKALEEVRVVKSKPEYISETALTLALKKLIVTR